MDPLRSKQPAWGRGYQCTPPTYPGHVAHAGQPRHVSPSRPKKPGLHTTLTDARSVAGMVPTCPATLIVRFLTPTGRLGSVQRTPAVLPLPMRSAPVQGRPPTWMPSCCAWPSSQYSWFEGFPRFQP